jgi:aspartate racemase
MSWQSSIEYYRIVNEAVHAKLGGVHSARSVMVSVDFADMEILLQQGNWRDLSAALIAAAQQVERGGADLVLLCTNTMHKVADDIQSHIHIPLLHIVDPTAQRVKASGISNIGLLGTRFTMEEPFFKNRLEERYGLRVLVPEAADRELVHRVIFDELVVGKIVRESRTQYMQVVERLIQAGAQGIILGCTEIDLLLHDGDCRVPLFDTTRLHAEAAVEYALAQ